jgi:hypothetical protein
MGMHDQNPQPERAAIALVQCGARRCNTAHLTQASLTDVQETSSQDIEGICGPLWYLDRRKGFKLGQCMSGAERTGEPQNRASSGTCPACHAEAACLLEVHVVAPAKQCLVSLPIHLSYIRWCNKVKEPELHKDNF